MLVWSCSHTCSVLHGYSLKQWGVESRGQIESKATHLCKRRHFQGNHLSVPDLFSYGQFSIHGKDSRALLFNKPLTQDHWHQLAVSQQVRRTHMFPPSFKRRYCFLGNWQCLVELFFPLRKYKQEGSPATWNLVSKQISLPQAAEITNLVLEHHSALDLYFVFMVKSLTNNKG